MSEETSESGSPIRRYNPREESWTPPDMSDSAMEAIASHIEQHIGSPGMVWHELVSDIVHIDVHQVAPTDDRPYWTLITSGMSDLPMKAPEGHSDLAYAELMLCLPKEWNLDEANLKDERYYWPIRWLKILARFPHEYQTWLGWGHTIPNGDPPQPFHESVPFDCMLLLLPRTVSCDFWELEIREDKIIHFYSIVPLFPGETALKLKKGTEEIDRFFEKHKVSEIVNPSRKDVSKRGWW